MWIFRVTEAAKFPLLNIDLLEVYESTRHEDVT